MWYGMPLGYDNALHDEDGNAWYAERMQQGDYIYYVIHIGSYTMNTNSMYVGTRSSGFYSFESEVIWVYRDSSGIRLQRGRCWASGSSGVDYAIKGIGGYYGQNAAMRKTWDNYPSVPSPAYNGGAMVDLYNIYSWGYNFGYIRIHTNDANGSGWGYSALTVPISLFPISYEQNVDPEIFDDDPNKQGGNSKTGGGHGNFDRTSDTITVPTLPALNATNAGFVTLFKPDLLEMLELSQRLWSPDVITLVSQLFGDPMDLVLGLGIVPVSAPATRTKSPAVGPIIIPMNIPVYDSQYYEVDCGTLTIKEFWGSALDYSPYTQIQIYLPYIGVRELNVDEIMEKTIGVKYHIDLFGGACEAFVTVNGSVRYQFSGNCLQQIPVGKVDYSSLVQNLVNVACVVGSGIAAAGTGGVAGAVATQAGAASVGAASAPMLSAGEQIAAGFAANVEGFAGWAAAEGGDALAQCTMDAVMNSKPRIERTGSLASTNGQLSIQTPFLIISRAEQSLPVNYAHYSGYPSNITAKLGSLSGFTKVESIRINDLAATQPELMEIYELLYKGVII